jgi:formate dehydrogenase subunit beta
MQNSVRTMIVVEGGYSTSGGNALAALRKFLRSLLEADVVDALFVPLETSKGTVLPALVTDPACLERANPLTPVMPINSARAVSALTGKHSPVRLGAVLRPCEMRALIELVKLQQASLEGVTLIGIDCPGTYEFAEYYTQQRKAESNLPGFDLAAVAQGQASPSNGLALRHACQMCIQPTPVNAAVHIHLFGAETGSGIPVELNDKLAARLQMPAMEGAESGKRKEVIDRLLAMRQQFRDKELATIRARLNSNGGIGALFDTCIRCHNCMTACPLCYCKTCLFRTAAFDHSPEHYYTAAHRKGAQRMLGDTLLFQMTRMNHMSASCVSCGMCTSACPSEIPVGAIFSAVGEQVQSAFGYSPGKDVAESLPLIAFQANEWTEVGEAK